VFDWTINFGHVLTIGAFIISAGGGIIALRGQVKQISVRMLAVESEMKKLVEILVGQARQEERIQAIDDRMIMHAQRMDEINRQVDRLFAPSVSITERRNHIK